MFKIGYSDCHNFVNKGVETPMLQRFCRTKRL